MVVQRIAESQNAPVALGNVPRELLRLFVEKSRQIEDVGRLGVFFALFGGQFFEERRRIGGREVQSLLHRFLVEVF